MNRHPGGEAQTLQLLKYVKLRKGMEALDLGAGEGETVRILRSLGINAHGVDLSPRSRDVQKGDFLNLDYTAESMDLCISQCAFFVSGDQQKAVSECWRVLKKGGVFALNDDMKQKMYGDMEGFAQKLRDMGYEEVRLVDTAQEAFGSHRRAAMMMLGSSRLLVGRK